MTRHQWDRHVERYSAPPPLWPWMIAAAVIAVIVFAILGGWVS